MFNKILKIYVYIHLYYNLNVICIENIRSKPNKL